MLTTALIPTNGIWITETCSPRGYLAGQYDAQGMVSKQRWFSTLAASQSYAATLGR